LSKTDTYCIFCKTGYEKEVEETLKNSGCTVIPSMIERNIVKNGDVIKTLRPLFPGYVFFEHTAEPFWRELRKEKNILYPLEYSENVKALRNGDLEFVQWLKNKKGIVKLSRAVEEGNWIKIIEGPLKEYEGKIQKINRRRKCMAVEIGTEKIMNRIWLSYEL
jgi:transcriptional antiterminator NusG